MADLTRKAAQAGYCVGKGAYNPANPIFCSLDPRLCPTVVEYDYRSTLEALNLKISCYFLQDTDSSPLAKCDDDRCAVDEESCSKAGGVLTPLYADDTFDPKCSMKNAIYGNCDGRCVWSASDCQPGETYNLPPTPALDIKTRSDDDCTCDKVKTGGCKKEGSSVLCTVSEASCEYTQTWLTHEEVKEQEGIECYLCREPPTPAPSETSSSSPSVSPPTRSPVKMPVKMPTASIDVKSSGEDDVKSGGSDPNMAAIIGGAVGGAVALSLIIGIVLFRAKRGRGSRASAPPPSNVFVS